MASLQNELRDKAELVNTNAEAFQQVSEELAEKDERLEKAIARQEELMSQMNRVSEQLQEKVTRLSQELEGSRTAYQTLDEQTRVVVKRLEHDRERLSNELERIKSEAAAQAEAKVADKLASLEEELCQAQRAVAEVEEAKATMEADILSQAAALAAATSRAEAAEEACQEACQRARADSSVGELFRPSPLDADGPAGMHLASKPMFGRTLSTMSAASSCQLASTEGRLAATEERLSIAESQVADMQAALARSRLVEQQATERAQEYRTSLELYKEFGAEGFLFAPTGREPIAPISPLGTGTVEKLRPTSSANLEENCSTEGSAGNLAAPPVSEVALPSVLIAMELDLGVATATLRVAPWQTRSDFDEVVREFLVENRVKLVFAEALVKYLEEVEVQASSFPAFVKADLADVYSLYA